MADFLAPSQYLKFTSPIVPLDMGMWTNIAELAFKQSQAQYDMLDKAKAALASTPATLLGDMHYKKQKTEELNKKIEALSGTGSFMSPKNMGAVRQILSDYTYDPELEAIKNRTTRIKEVQDRIDKDQLPLSNYLGFYQSVESANEEFLKTGEYNPNPSLKYNVTPYTNTTKNMMEVVKEIPEISNSTPAFTSDGNYAYIATTKGRDPNATMAALRAALGPADWQQFKADYDYMQSISPESLKVNEDVKDDKGTIIIPKGSQLTFDQYVNSEVVKIAAAVTGQSFEIKDFQQSVDSKLRVKEMEIEARKEIERLKKEGAAAQDPINYGSVIKGTQVPITPVNGASVLSDNVTKLDEARAALETEESILKQQESAGTATESQKGRVALLRSQVESLKLNVENASKVITTTIPDDEAVKLVTLPSYASGRTRQIPGVFPGPTESYNDALAALGTEMYNLVKDNKMNKEDTKQLRSMLPMPEDGVIDNPAEAKSYIAWLLATDLDKQEAKIRSTEAYKSWDKSSYFRGPWAEGLNPNEKFGRLFKVMRQDKAHIKSKYKDKIERIDKADEQVANIKMLTAQEYWMDGEAKAHKHDLYLFNDQLTKDVQTSPASWVDARTGQQLSDIIKSEGADISKTTATTTDGFINGNHVIAVSVFSKKGGGGDAALFQKTYVMYNPDSADATANGTAAALDKAGDERALQFRADLKYLMPMQKAEPILSRLKSVNTVDEAIASNNVAVVTMGANANQEAINMHIYKVRDNEYYIGSEVNGKLEIDRTRSFSNLRDIAKSLQIAEYQTSASNSNKAQNQINVVNSLSKVFPEVEGYKREYIEKAIGYETGNTYGTNTNNGKGSNAVGLIQFYPTRKTSDGSPLYDFQFEDRDGKAILKTFTKSQMENMDHETQTVLVKSFFKTHKVDPTSFESAEEAWLSIFLPGVYNIYSSNRAVNNRKTLNELILQTSNGAKLLANLKKDDKNSDFILDAINNNHTMGVFLTEAKYHINK